MGTSCKFICKYRRASKKIRIKQTDDLSSIKTDIAEFYSQEINAESLIEVPVVSDSSGDTSVRSEVVLTAALDPNFSTELGSITAGLEKISNEDFLITSKLNWSQAFNIPLQFSGLLFLKAQNAKSESEDSCVHLKAM